jgi:RNA polymerase sigma factor (sigma-70 family)
MARVETIALVRKAREGDRQAWRDLLEQYYTSWLGRYHGQLGSTVRRLYDTQDLVQSAVGDVLRDLPQLKSEAAFYTWVTSILRHKVAHRRRELRREVSLGDGSKSGAVESLEKLGGPAGPGKQPEGGGPEPSATELDDYIRALDVILDLFPRHPEPMAAVAMMFLDALPVEDMVERFGKSKSSVYRWLEEGLALLKRRLKPGGEGARD